MQICPQCGTDALCPACLLASGISLSESPETELTAGTERLAQTAPPEAPDSDSFGPYRILRVLGEGGMGAVYLAEQTHPLQRRVALKVIKPGLDTGEILSRFAYERQALAMMDHPNIARVYDAGASRKGRPYFVMEYIDGAPITKFCDTHRLNTRERLELFVPVCQALQHAHAKGVIHRDIKPSNVMVVEQDARPVPKVIDFGIARATDQRGVENAAFTKLEQFVGTPEYMSPEQADLTRIWQVAGGEAIGILRLSGPAVAAAFSPDARLLAVTGSGTVSVWDVSPETGILARDIVTRIEPTTTSFSSGGSMTFSPDGKVLFAPSESGTRLWDVPSETELPPIPGTASLLALSGDGKRLATSNPFVSEAGTFGVIESSAGDKYLATLHDGVTLWDLENPSAHLNLSWPGTPRFSQANSIALSPDGRLLIAGQDNGILRVWDAVTGQQTHAIQVVPESRPSNGYARLWGVYCVVFAPDGKTFATGNQDRTVVIWDSGTMQRRLTLRGSTLARYAAFDRTGRFLATASGSSATIWDLSTGRELFLLSGGDASIGQVAFSSDGARLLTGGADGTLRIWQVKTGQEIMTLRGHDRGIGSIALSPNDDAFATNGHDGVLRLWRVATPQMVEAQLRDPGLEEGLRSIRAGMVTLSAPDTVASSKNP